MQNAPAQQHTRTKMGIRMTKSNDVPLKLKKLDWHRISLSSKTIPLGQAHSPTIRATSPPNQRAWNVKGFIKTGWQDVALWSVAYAWLEVKLVVLAIELWVDPIAISRFSAQEPVDFAPTVPFVEPDALLSAPTPTSESGWQFAELVSSVSHGTDDSCLLESLQGASFFLVSSAAVSGRSIILFFVGPIPASSADVAGGFLAAKPSPATAAGLASWRSLSVVDIQKQGQD